MRFSALCVIVLICLLTSCQAEVIDPNAPPPSSGGTGGTGGNATPGCNNTTMKLKKRVSINNSLEYIDLGWNGDNIDSIKYNVPLSEYRTAKYVYSNGKITQAILINSQTGSVYDTAVFHYNAAGKVDSMYLKNDDWFDMTLTYDAAGKLIKHTRYAGGEVLYYWTVETDANGNVVKAVEYYDDGAVGYDKQSTYTFTRDTKKNPFNGLSPYMFYLNEPYEIFWLWGPNNFIDQRYQDHAGSGIDLTTGHKYKYNSNCYPTASQTTIMGQAMFPGDDYNFIYN